MGAEHVAFFLLCILFISDTSIGEKPPSEAILDNTKLDHQHNEMFFSPLVVSTQRDTSPGNVPIVNPTPPGTGTIPIVNPTNPSPPATTGPTNPSPPAMTGPTNPLPPTRPTPTSSGSGSWCTALPSASQTALQVGLDYACGYGGADCAAIQPSGACYNPNTVREHASYAFNDYYQKNPIPTSCDFGGAAQLTSTDPSHGNCRYASSTSTPTTTRPPAIPTPAIPMTPPSTSIPVTPYPPGGNGYGSQPTVGYDSAEPTGMPNSVGALSFNLLLLFIPNCIILSAIVSNSS